jgi:hypothetical protein
MGNNKGKHAKGNFTPMTTALVVKQKRQKSENIRQHRKGRRGKTDFLIIQVDEKLMQEQQDTTKFKIFY